MWIACNRTVLEVHLEAGRSAEPACAAKDTIVRSLVEVPPYNKNLKKESNSRVPRGHGQRHVGHLHICLL